MLMSMDYLPESDSMSVPGALRIGLNRYSGAVDYGFGVEGGLPLR